MRKNQNHKHILRAQQNKNRSQDFKNCSKPCNYTEISRKPHGLSPKTHETDKQLQQSLRIQNQCAKMTSIPNHCNNIFKRFIYRVLF